MECNFVQGKLSKGSRFDVVSWDARTTRPRSVPLGKHRTKQDSDAWSLIYTKLIEKWMRFLKHKNRNPKHVVCGSRGSLWPFAPIETNHSSSILGILYFSMDASIAGIWCLHAS